MKEMKRWLALFLCFVMLIGVMPVSALAEDTVQETTIATEAAETTAATSEPTETEAPSSEATEPEGTTAPSSEPTQPEGTTAPSSEPTGSTEPAVVAVTGITLDVTALEVCVGAEPVTLTATVTPEDATDKTVTWESSDEEVATVDENGTVTFRMLGDAVITAIAGEFSAECTVRVYLDEEEITGYADSGIDYLFLATDRHSNTSVIGKLLTKMESVVGDGAIGYVGLGGDMVNGTSSYNSSTVLNEVTAVASNLGSSTVDLVYASSHDVNCTDDAGIMNMESGLMYTDDNYYVYGITQDEMGYNNASLAVTPAAEFTDWVNSLPASDDRVIIVLSHLPIHASRNDNLGAGYWNKALNTAATGSADGTEITRNVLFFHGHNHTTESNKEYFYSAGSQITVESYVEDSGNATNADTSDTIYYTYTTAGYLNANSQATLVSVTDTTITLDKYTTSSYSTLDTVTRVASSGDSGDSGETTDPTDPDEGGESGGTTTTTKDVYVLVDTMTVGKDYLIANGNSGTVTLLGQSSGSATTTTATVVTEGDYTYIETADAGYVWNATAHTNSSYSSYPRLINAETYAMYASSGSLAFSNSLTSTSGAVYTRYWTYTDGQLACVSTNSSSTTYYLTYSDSAFDMTSTATDGIYIYEKQTINVETEVTLSSIAVTTAPTTTTYNVGGTFSADGMVVTATYSDGTSEVVTPTSVSTPDMTTAGTKTVTVTYTEGEVTRTTTFQIVVNEVISETATVTAIEVTGGKTEYTLDEAFSYEGLTVTATYDDNGTTKTKVLDAGEYTVSEPDMTTEGTKTVTVSYTFNGTTVTDTYDITVTEEPSNEVTVGGTTTTTKTKTVYVLSSGNPSGNVLIADSATAGDVHLVANDGGDLSNTTATVVYGDCDGDGDSEYYIELTDTEATNSLWTVSNSYRFANQDEYLRCSNGSLSVSSQSTTWSYSSNRLSYTSSGNSGPGNKPGQGSSNTTYYLRYNNGWTVTSSSSSATDIYFYVPTEVEYDETVDTTVKYTMRAENLKQVVDTTNTTTLAGQIDFCLQGNGTDLTTLPSGGSYSFSVLSDENGIISGVIASDGSFTFSGTTGTAKVKVAYTWTQDGKTYTVYKNITVEATEPYYELDLHKANISYTEVTGEFDSTATYFIKNEDGTYEKVEITAFEDGVTYYTVSATVGDEITEVIAIKGIEAGDRYGVWAVITGYDGVLDDNGEDGSVLADVADGDIVWSSSDETIATVDPTTGIITFTGKEGTVQITADYAYGTEGKIATDTITISVTQSQYNVPADGTTDFPEYPNEGAIRFDKTATAVGNFSETGIAQVELSMTGVPYTSGSEIDVVVMLDMSTSMDDDRIAATVAATKVFVESIVKNEDGSYNSNRIYVGYFNGDTVYTITDSGNIGGELATVDNDTEYNALIDDIEADYDGALTASGTNYDVSLEECYNVLTAAKTDGTGNNRAQYCVFMSDGGPTDYATSASNVVAESTVVKWFDVSDSDSANWTNSMVEEYWSGLMKDNGVSIYSVGMLLNEAPGSTGPQDYQDYSADQNYYVTSTLLTGIASGSDYFYNCESADDTADMEEIFGNIAVKILQAATDVTVEDKITDEYTMIFDIPTDTNYDHTISTTQEFYIEFLKYTLDANHERVDSDSDGDTYDDATSITKLYLKKTDGVYSAASDADGTAYAAPVFAQTTIGDKGTLYYWTTDSSYSAKAAVSYNDGTNTYYFIPYGMEANEDGTAPDGWYNMTSGAYAYGTVDSVSNTSTDLVIATPYFVYNAGTKMLYWTVDKLDTEEYALRYFLYLDDSATDVGESTEVDAATYPTNEHAYITYTNFKGNDCRQEFPIPQLTWSGAQVSYVFYLVNSAGQPINKSGQVVDFANATFITDIYTTAVVWNKGTDGQIEGDANLSIDWLAEELLPSEYAVYDENAGYELHVYGDHTGASIFDYFVIEGDTAANISSSLNTRLDLETTASTVSVETTKVYNTKAGTKYDDYGVYTSDATDKYDGETVLSGFDFANTTVAFAVVWEPKLVPDTVVVDYGLDVVINVVQNDILQNTVNGIGVGKDAYDKENIAIDTGVSTTSKLGNAPLTIEGNTISIENENAVRFSQGDMEFATPVVFYYETPVEFYEDSEKQEGYMYSSVTVIPATTIYYEDKFVDLTVWNSETYELLNEQWTTEGSVISATQDQDRPGKSQISEDLDADNLYGYDSAYTSSSMYSLGSAAKVTVNSNKFAEAKFTFYGTGFDVISLTSNTTGTIAVDVYDADAFAASGYDAATVTTKMVDTYYGYKQEAGDADGDGTIEDGELVWVVDTEATDTLYQVPVMKISGLDYDKYTVVITVAYYDKFDHQGVGSLDFYMDAIRIYDPANDGAADGATDTTIEDAYEADGEEYPEYFELRNKIISADTFNSLPDSDTSIEGIVFIDGDNEVEDLQIEDYVSYGPNNEVYLASGQAVAFDLNASATEGSSVSKIQLAVKTVGGEGSIKVYGVDTSNNQTVSLEDAITTATDLYYDITALNGKTVVIQNTGADTDAIISITNVKVTYTEAQPSASDVATASEEEENTETPMLFSIRRSTADAAVASLSETEETESETTVPEETEPETTIPEETEPETTVPEETEPETTVPDESEPAVDPEEIVNSVVKTVTDIINAIKNIFSKWFA